MSSVKLLCTFFHDASKNLVLSREYSSDFAHAVEISHEKVKCINLMAGMRISLKRMRELNLGQSAGCGDALP
jgi:hypothetical protein